MSIFDSIKNAILRRSPSAAQPTRPAPTPSASASAPAATQPRLEPAAVPVAAPALEIVDVEVVLERLSQKHSGKLNWRTSIVDLLKLLDLDSSLANRKDLASELGYTGDMSDSARMNIWLHRQVMQKLAENGGKVPSSLLS